MVFSIFKSSSTGRSDNGAAINPSIVPRSSISSTSPRPAYTPNSVSIDEKKVDDCSVRSKHFATDSTQPAPANTPGTVPICPHESLTPERRLALILDLPNFKPELYHTTGEIDALTWTPSAHHRNCTHKKPNVPVEPRSDCQPLGLVKELKKNSDRDQIMAVQGIGEIFYLNYYETRHTEILHSRISAKDPSPALCMTWTIYLNPLDDEVKSLEAFGDEVEKAGVRLCTHKRLSDYEFIEPLFEVAGSYSGLRDPIVRYRQKLEGHNCQSRLVSSSLPVVISLRP